jgi:DNA-binding beta-propeller fold protein YncE
MRYSGILLAGLMAGLAIHDNAQAGLVAYKPGFTPILRASGFQSYPLAIDAEGDIFTVTGTSPGDRLMEVTASGQVITLNSFVGGVIGTHSKLAFGFGGNLFATSQGAILEFSPTTGSRQAFFSGQQDGDAGLAFDSSRQLLWVANSGPMSNDIIALDSTGAIVETIHNASYGGYGMALDHNGDLILITASGMIERINPETQAVTQIADLTSVLPQANIRSLAIDPSNGYLYFAEQYSGLNSAYIAMNGLYRIAPDGSDLTRLISGFNGQMAFGASSEGNGRLSIYLGDPVHYQLFEVRSVPEPSSVVMTTIGIICCVSLARRGLRREVIDSTSNRM